jgi:aminoglycoside/choline kinase family phosphotransferase
LSARDATIAAFLKRCGWGDAQRRPLAGDASFRRYDRLQGPRGNAVLMDAPPPHEDIRPFVAIDRYLAGLGLGAPAILGEDAEAGLLLLEDLGDAIYKRVIAGGMDEIALYLAAVDALVALHRAAPPLGLATYDAAEMLARASLFTEWFMPLAGLPLDEAGKADFAAAWRVMLPAVHRVPQVVVLRDYHAENLLWLPEREGLRKVGQLDFQDATLGPATYDLVSLLEDARRDVAPMTVAACLDHYRQAFPELDPDDFAAAYAVTGAQRNFRILGVFCRLLKRDGKPAYQDLMDRVWGHVATDLSHPATAPLARWLDRWVPPARRTRAA